MVVRSTKGSGHEEKGMDGKFGISMEILESMVGILRNTARPLAEDVKK